MKSSVDRIGTLTYLATIFRRSRQVLFIHKMYPNQSSETETVEGSYIISMSRKAVILTKKNEAGIQAPFIVKRWKRVDFSRELARALHNTALNDSSMDEYEDIDGGIWYVFNRMNPEGECVDYHPPASNDSDSEQAGQHESWYSIALKPY